MILGVAILSEDTFHLGIKGLIVDSEGKILLLKVNPARLKGGAEPKDYWDLPGGRVQQGHTIADTLVREIEEETGISSVANIQPLGMVLSNIRIPVGDNTVGLILSIYSCSVPEDSIIKISDEHTASEWFTTKEAANLLAIKYPPEFCRLLTKYNRSNTSHPANLVY